MDITNEDLKVIEIKENPDGSADLILEMSDHFKNEFKKHQGLKRFSQKRFQKWVIEALERGLEYEERTSG